MIQKDTGPIALTYDATDNSNCSTTPTANAFCYAPETPYTEWRTGFTTFNGGPTEDACVQSFSDARIWCEMPWTRPVGIGSDGLPTMPCWKTIYKQPFYYRQEDGKCYITKSYCENNLSEGGFDGSYGDAHDYIVLQNCTHPQGESNEIQSGYDCCTSLSSSIAQFFFGQTIPAEFDNLSKYYTQGKPQVTQCDNVGSKGGIGGALDPLVSFLSDERLKTNITMVEENGCGMDINVYHYEWSPLARRLYKKPAGVVEGLLMKELEAVFPQCVRLSQFGHKMFSHSPELMPKLTDIRFLVYASVMAYLLSSNDVLDEDE